jgi:hypothetical protein
MFSLMGVLLLAGSSGVAQAQVQYQPSIVPQAPKAQQPVYAQVEMGFCEGTSEVRFVNGVLMVEVIGFLCGTPPPGTFTNTISLGRLPSGTYRLVLFDQVSGQIRLRSPEVSFTVSPAETRPFYDDVYPNIDASGWWHNPQRNGEGWFVEHHYRDRVMVGWVTYRPDGSQEWYVMQSVTRNGNILSGPIYRTQGTPPSITITAIGTARFEVLSDNAATFTVVQQGQADRVVELQRLPF